MNWLLVAASFFGVVLCCAFSFALSGLRFALAKLKFAGSKDKKFPQTKAEKFLLEKSREASIAVSMATKLSFALNGLFVFSGLVKLFENFSVGFSTGQTALLVAFSFVAATFLQYCFAEMPACYYASAYPEKTLSLSAKPFFFVFALLAPFEFASRKLACKIFGKKIENELDSFDYIDVDVKLRAEESETGQLGSVEESIVKNTMRLNDLEVFDVMIPRNEASFINLNDSFEQNMAMIRQTRHIRYPICNGDLDKCEGFLHIKDIAVLPVSNNDFISLKREILKISENERISEAFSIFKEGKSKIALVLDEFGGASGILTLDCIVEAVIGNMRDEFDKTGLKSAKKLGENNYETDGLKPLREFSAETGIQIDSDTSTTIGGLITETLGRFPKIGETVKIPDTNVLIKIKSLEKTRIGTCVVMLKEPEENDSEN